MHAEARLALAGVLLAAGGARHLALGFGVCPPGNDPKCWNAEFTCRRCCDLARGPEGDASCWLGNVNYISCCLGTVSLGADPTAEELEICHDAAGWLQAGRDPMAVPRAKLWAVYHKAKACTPVGNVLHLALLAPLFQEAEGNWLVEQAIFEAEGIVQWFIDSLVSMVASLSTQGFGVFFVLHRVLSAAASKRSGSVSAVGSSALDSKLLEASGGLSRASQWGRLALMKRALRWGSGFSPGLVAALLEPMAADRGGSQDTAVRVVPAQTPPLPCSLEAAVALVMHADIKRLADGARSEPFLRALQAVQECLNDVTLREGELVRQLMSVDAPPLLLVLDRLECKPEALVNLDNDPFISVFPEALHGNFRVAVLPMRDWESDFVRGYRELHCSDQIRELILRRLPWDRGGAFLDVGANIGGCSLWAARLMPGSEVIAVEPFGAATGALNRSVQMLGLESRVSVVRACVRHEGQRLQLRRVLPDDLAAWSTLQVRWRLEERGSPHSRNDSLLAEADEEESSTEVVQCRRLDELVSRRVAVMRIHTSGEEVSALASALGLARRGLLGAVALQFPSLAQARLLWEYGLVLELNGRQIPRLDEEAFEAARTAPDAGYHDVLIGVAAQ